MYNRVNVVGQKAEPRPQTVAEEHLVRALELVRGTPFADAYPGEWRWAEQLRIDIARDVRDVAHELTNRALDRNLIDLARWAAGSKPLRKPRGRAIALDRYRTERQAGAQMEVNRLASRLRGNARRTRQPLAQATAAALLTSF